MLTIDLLLQICGLIPGCKTSTPQMISPWFHIQVDSHTQLVEVAATLKLQVQGILRLHQIRFTHKIKEVQLVAFDLM